MSNMSQEPGAAARADPEPGLRVLVAEDHFINRELIVRLLEHLGVQVESVTDGMQAYMAVLRSRFDLVFMDCQMPRMDGFQATRSIRAHERSSGCARATIIALTANTFEHDRQRCEEAGMDDFLAKPIPIKQLSATLERWRAGAARGGASEADCLPPSAAVDPRALEALRSLQRPGGPNLLTTLLDDYLQSSPPKLAELLQALARGQSARASELAHGLKSISATLGARALAATLARIETEQRADAGSDAEQPRLLQEQHAHACSALQQILGRERGGEPAR
jgi:CheY-like chemotaxis protein